MIIDRETKEVVNNDVVRKRIMVMGTILKSDSLEF